MFFTCVDFKRILMGRSGTLMSALMCGVIEGVPLYISVAAVRFFAETHISIGRLSRKNGHEKPV